jgi:hypothetical protein
MFTAVLFTTAKLQNQPRFLSTNKWMKKMWYLYTLDYYSTIKKNEIMCLAGKHGPEYHHVK